MKNLKKAILLAAIILGYHTCFAQANSNAYYEKFDRSFSSIINYPIELIRNCTPTVCLLKIEVDTAKNVVSLKLSDSADSLLKVEFKLHEPNLNIKLLENYLKTEYTDSKCFTYLIPLSYSLYQASCPSQNVKMPLLDSYFKFDGGNVSGNVIILKPISNLLRVQR